MQKSEQSIIEQMGKILVLGKIFESMIYTVSSDLKQIISRYYKLYQQRCFKSASKHKPN